MNESDDEGCLSPFSCVNSAVDGLDFHYLTPATSPGSSPCKATTATGLDSLLERLVEDQEHDDTKFYAATTSIAKKIGSNESVVLHHDPVASNTSQQDAPRAREPLRLQTSRRLDRVARTSTPRSSRHYLSSIDYPDRFVPGRCATPTKQALLLCSSPSPSPDSHSLLRQDDIVDPFLPSIRPSTRISERYATLRTPIPPPRPTGLVPSSVTARQTASRNAWHALDLAVSWSANGQPVTEGVASTTNSRGGRITSGSNAPHFCADLLRLTEKDQGYELHERRLAIAMDVDQASRLIKPGAELNRKSQEAGLEYSIVHHTKTAWKDSRWQQSKPFTGPAQSTSEHERVPTIPYRVLDAPTLRDDFYCSLLAYDPVLDCLAVGLANHIYIWSEKGRRRSEKLPESLVSHHNQHHVTTLSFSSPGNKRSILAIGRSDGLLSLWHPLDKQPRMSRKHPVPISFVSFRPCTIRRPSLRDPQITVDTEELLVGDDLGKVMLYSLEWPDQNQCNLFNWISTLTLRAVITCHTQQICGITWSADGEQFATGGNDNRLFVFDYSKVERTLRGTEPSQRASTAAQRILARMGREQHTVTSGEEKQSFFLNAAVKAIAFAPWQSDLLVAGGGSNDRCVHFFHIRSGARLATINCHAQVTSVIWNTQRRELAVTLGFAQPKHSFRVTVFAWPSCDLLASIPWAGEERALYAIPFPGGPLGKRDAQRQSLVVATSDASIKFHEVWPKRKIKNSRVLMGVESQILSDTCSEELEQEGVIR